MDSTKHHIVMLPFMAHGHLIPFLSLAKKIHHKTGFTITIANTPLNIKYLRSTFNSIESEIQLFELPFTAAADYGLPPNTENSENLPLDLIGQFFASSTALKTPVHDLLSDIVAKEGKPPICVISDIFFGWANDVAKSVGSVNLSFSTCGAYGSLAFISLWLNLPHRKVDSDEFQIPGFPESCRFHITQLHHFIRNADGSDVWSKFMQPQIALSLQSAGLLCNTVEEIEVLGLDLLRKFVKIPVWSVGPLLPSSMLNNSSEKVPICNIAQHTGKQTGISAEKCLNWLDLQRTSSVLYLSFGSQNSITPSQMMELATGLEESKKPFIWVIRPPVGFDRKAEFKSEWLPEGFEDRISTTKQGMLVRNWAPQLEILSHKSTGAFLSHCGWNSVMESLSQGVPIIGWPLAAEQAYNSKMLVEEMGVSVELARGLQSTISWKEVKNVVEIVMDENGKGGEMRKKAIEIGKMIRESVNEKGSSGKALDDIVSMLLSITR
ncbi:UDP-glycosyltransferase 92A1-like [Euphorbia lathyris]|uniref:UDP-glycosyltransferase 92A1-like n=1 Tax=Euphorbia lathyris TaxID=212925 RepID=UPI0033136A9C